MQWLSRPVLPGGASGITIGIGYDLGQHTADEITADWSRYYPGIDIPDAFRAPASLQNIRMWNQPASRGPD